MAKEDVIKEFTKIKSVGRAKAELLYDTGFDSIEKLKKAAIKDLVKIYGITDSIAKNIKDQLKEQCKNLASIKDNYRKLIVKEVSRFKEAKYIMSLPGLKEIQSSKIIAQVIDPNRFVSRYKFYAYCGLVKHPRISVL